MQLDKWLEARNDKLCKIWSWSGWIFKFPGVMWWHCVDWCIGTSVLEKLGDSMLFISKHSNISLGQQGTPKQWYIYSYVHGITSKKPEILKWQIVLLMVNISRKHRLSFCNCSHFENHIVETNNNFFTTNSQPHTIIFLHLKENSQAQIAEKDYKHPFKNESLLAMHMALDLQYSANLILQHLALNNSCLF
jgi:hypothetical protein